MNWSVIQILLITLLSFSHQAALPDDQITKALNINLNGIYPTDTYRYQLELKFVPVSLHNLSQNSRITIELESTAPRGYQIVTVHYDENGITSSDKIQVFITLFARVPVVNRSIGSGEMLTAGDLTMVWKDVTRVNEPFFTELNQVVGARTARRILKDMPVLGSHIRDEASLETGTSMRMIYMQQGLRIELPVVLRQKASPGETARAYHRASGKHFEIRITESGQAEWLRTL
ncbi:MAG: flagella basal body P-ring formation protein FlgA [Balneolaceae bacterium]|nr:MAG: flagella basal body P-ring formation protein FlgA [Balneolaceae bacterium]